ncbi:MAG: hypothetical protein Unbinned4162contig1001_32 [Prokaryotic dsDNA virus sp.]|nr:MAG: hypothetical protein Unbinned4162contig1001_32 [Prokaryotic dsDNA virus sp.]|tara:strand:- start:7702 stop:7968 length:267 start_codon:yes stop_codon:yes gene_type:complete
MQNFNNQELLERAAEIMGEPAEEMVIIVCDEMLQTLAKHELDKQYAIVTSQKMPPPTPSTPAPPVQRSRKGKGERKRAARKQRNQWRK